MFCRTAIAVLREVGTFTFSDREDFHKKMKEIDWSRYFGPEKTMVIYSVATRSEVFSNTLFLSQLTKDAVADYFREKTGMRPTVNKDDADIRLNIYVNENRCIVSLDSSGEPLFKRGYRKQAGGAPLNEVLAAGLILHSGWDKQSPFVDPMCGSATFSIEAAMMAQNIAPGTLRKFFSFMHWNDFDPNLWDEVKQEAKMQENNSKLTIIAGDIASKSIDISRKNILQAGFLGQIKLQKQDFFLSRPPAGNGVVILNPPYGERLKQENLTEFYSRIGDTLKNNYAGYKAGIITSDVPAMKSIGLKTITRVPVFNGALECKFMVYEMFAGTHKDHVIARPKRKRIVISNEEDGID
jgi:putative N6-adenine-specific DNA methylase